MLNYYLRRCKTIKIIILNYYVFGDLTQHFYETILKFLKNMMKNRRNRYQIKKLVFKINFIAIICHYISISHITPFLIYKINI